MKNQTMHALIERYGREQVFVIAEAGTSHAGEIQQATELIHAASEAGAAAIKFQIVFADEILHPQSGELLLVGKRVKLYQKFKALERNEVFFQQLKATATKQGILFLASAFGTKSVNILKILDVAAYKLASPELNFYDLWRLVLPTKRPIFFSTGMSQQSDISNLLSFFNREQETDQTLYSRLALLQCITCYPSRVQDYNLLTLHVWERFAGLVTGLSDHTAAPATLPRLALWLKLLTQQPFILEKHITLTRRGSGLDDPIAITPRELGELMKELIGMARGFRVERYRTSEIMAYLEFVQSANIATENSEALDIFSLELKNYLTRCKQLLLVLLKRELTGGDYTHARLEACLGTGMKTLVPCEVPFYKTTRRSLLAVQDIPKGECLSQKNSAFLRAEQGNEPGLSTEWEETWRQATSTGREAFCSSVPIISGTGITMDKLKRITT